METHELTLQLAKHLGMSPQHAQNAVKATFLIIESELKKGNQVTISGFGVFEVITARPRAYTNPETGKVEVEPENSAPMFRFAREIRSWFKEKLKK
ncbi:MAG: HU family DNA-binding protein [Candidatus Wallbacteria bacterium]|nr:HU family DNA-binding protein [Candidatus Wallbacteria bacterium]